MPELRRWRWCGSGRLFLQLFFAVLNAAVGGLRLLGTDLTTTIRLVGIDRCFAVATQPLSLGNAPQKIGPLLVLKGGFEFANRRSANLAGHRRLARASRGSAAPSLGSIERAPRSRRSKLPARRPVRAASRQAKSDEPSRKPVVHVPTVRPAGHREQSGPSRIFRQA